jgi:hypothetical protein
MTDDDAEFDDDMPSDIKEELLADGIMVKSHIEKDHKEECGYCGQLFGPDDIVIEKRIHESIWCFCSEECYRDFVDASNFKDDEFEKEKQGEGNPYDEPEAKDDL